MAMYCFSAVLERKRLEARLRAKKLSITIAGTTGCDLLPELDRLPTDSVIVKKRYSAFFSTSLDARLSEARLEFLVVAGVNTHACVRMTAIDAYQRDHEGHRGR